MPAEDLDPAKRPAKALLLESVECQRHQALAPRRGLVDSDRSLPQHAKAGVRVFRDDRFVPATDPFEGGAADQSHRAREDDGVAVGARGHRHVEEILVAVVEATQVAAILPVAIILRGLHESDAIIGKMTDHRRKEAWLDDVVRIDDAEDADI